MNPILNKKSVLFLLVCAVVILGFYYLRFGVTVGCPYTEVERPLSPDIMNAKIFIARGASLLEGDDSEYLCLPQMGQLKFKLVEPNSAANFNHQIKNLKIDHLTQNSDLEFTAVKLVSVTKHGIGTIDSGKGPVEHLILKDQHARLYDVALVYLEFSKFLKAKINDQEIFLTPELIRN